MTILFIVYDTDVIKFLHTTCGYLYCKQVQRICHLYINKLTYLLAFKSFYRRSHACE